MHKHMQVFPRPLDFVLFPDRPVNANDKIPYLYKLVRHSSIQYETNNTESVFNAYQSYMEHVRALLGKAPGEHIPHNVVMVREWTMVIPRRTASIGGLGANAAAMIGLVWVANERDLELWAAIGLYNALSQFGIDVAESDKHS